MIDPVLTSASSAALQQAINTALSLDETTQKKLAQHDSRSIQLCCTAPEINITVVLGAQVHVLQNGEPTADSCISGDATAWLELATAEDAASTLINGQLQISGDSQLLMDIKSIAAAIELDWEGHLAQFIGDVPAHLLGKLASAAGTLGNQTQKTLRRTLVDFLHEEARLLPSRIEADNAAARLREIEMQLERVEAKLAQRKQAAAGK